VRWLPSSTRGAQRLDPCEDLVHEAPPLLNVESRQDTRRPRALEEGALLGIKDIALN